MAMVRTHFRRRNAAGFSLIEGMIASFVFLLGMTGLLAAIVHARTSTAQARRQVRATAVAEDLVAQVQLWPYDDARLVSSGFPCVDDPTDAGHVLDGGDDTQREAFLRCLADEARLKSGTWGGLPTSDFPVGTQEWDRFQRYFVVREMAESGALVPAGQANTGVRKLVWVLVVYRDGVQVRKVTSQLVKPNPRAMTRAPEGV